MSEPKDINIVLAINNELQEEVNRLRSCIRQFETIAKDGEAENRKLRGLLKEAHTKLQEQK